MVFISGLAGHFLVYNLTSSLFKEKEKGKPITAGELESKETNYLSTFVSSFGSLGARTSLNRKSFVSFVWNLLPNDVSLKETCPEKIPRDEEKESSSTSRLSTFLLKISSLAGWLTLFQRKIPLLGLILYLLLLGPKKRFSFSTRAFARAEKKTNDWLPILESHACYWELILVLLFLSWNC